MAYTVLARRYRSQTFDDVLGQDVAAQTLRNAIAAGRVAHAYLFCGTRGCGKTTMARILAKSLNCLNTNEPTIHPCLKCDSCKSINTGEDIDVIEIDGASNTGVDNIRQLRDNAIYRPARARFKIYIIDEVHMLSTGAFNALLKILEEPPAHVKFIFATTEPNKVLATIQSRCQRFDFHNIRPEVISRQVSKILTDEGITFEPDLLITLSRLANGSMRDALSLLDQLISAGAQPLTGKQLTDLVGIPDRQKVAQLLTAIADHGGAAALDGLNELLLTGQSASQICDALVEMMREAMVFQCAGKDSVLLPLTEQERADLAGLAGKFDIAGLIYNITALEKLRWTLKNSETSRALLEASLLRLALSEHFIGLDQLAAQMRTGVVGGAVDVKKKSLTLPVSDSPIRAAAPPPMPSSPSALAIGNVPAGQEADSEEILSCWPQWVDALCQTLPGGVAMMLSQAKAAAVKGNAIQLAFADTGQGKMAQQVCQSKSAAIEKELAAIAGRPMTLAFGGASPLPVQAAAMAPVAGGVDLFGAPVAQTPAELSPASSAPPRTATRLERNEALNDPVVKMVLLGLNATPIDIQKVEYELPEPDHEYADGQAE